MLNPLDHYYATKDEPLKSCLQFLRAYMLNLHPNVIESWKYGAPFFSYNKKMFCYLWIQKKTNIPYIGIVEGAKINHPDLIQENRKRMKILLIDPSKDIPIRKLNTIMKAVIKLYTDKNV